MTTLVIGAQPRSIGAAIQYTLCDEAGLNQHVVTAGISGEDLHLDVTDVGEVESIFRSELFDHVIYTAGVNRGTLLDLDTAIDDAEIMWRVNCLGALDCLRWWLMSLDQSTLTQDVFQQFVVVSSNSAEVPRSTGIAYCATKAALSHAIRSAARAVPSDVVLWGLEPGWVNGTPMSSQVADRLGGLDRMRGGAMCDAWDLAGLVEWAMKMNMPKALNGMMIRLDGGER